MPVVSFLGRLTSADSRFSTDVWLRSDQTWKLAVRYAGPARDDLVSLPAAGPKTDDQQQRR